MAPIPFNDLGRQMAPLAAQVERAIHTVLDSGWFILGPQVEAFEAEFAGYCGANHCIGAGNGTDALELALRALEIGAGDRVATVANAGGYSTTAILAAGAEPVYVDVDAASMNMNPHALAAALHRDVRAVIVTHLYGRMAPMPAILQAAGGVPVIEDCAQSHGARLDGRSAGTWGSLGCFSFYPTKNLGAAGDGGAVVTADGALAARVRGLAQYGWAERYHMQARGGRNSRLDEIQAAVLRVKLPKLAGWNARRVEIARTYDRLLQGAGLSVAPARSDSVAHLYTVRSRQRDVLRAALAQASIGTAIHYPIPDHLQEFARGQAWADCRLPVTTQCCREVLSLPCFPELSDSEVQRVAEAVRAAAEKAGD